jgi:hypothetical protein
MAMNGGCAMTMRSALAAKAGLRANRVQNETWFMASGVGLIGC